MDRARIQTDKILHNTLKDIGRVYKTSSALSRIMKEIDKYMNNVEKATESLYRAYMEESDTDVREEKKKAYMVEIRKRTLESEEYMELMKKFVQALAAANQEALAEVNRSMADIYAVNYNQVAVECRKAGISVNGKEQI